VTSIIFSMVFHVVTTSASSFGMTCTFCVCRWSYLYSELDLPALMEIISKVGLESLPTATMLNYTIVLVLVVHSD